MRIDPILDALRMKYRREGRIASENFANSLVQELSKLETIVRETALELNLEDVVERLEAIDVIRTPLQEFLDTCRGTG